MRRRLLLGTLLLAAAMALEPGSAFGAHESLSMLLPGNPLEGSRLFTGKGCPSCHAVHGVGGTAGPDLGRGSLNRGLLEIGAVMWNHSPGMERVFQEKRIIRPTFDPAEMASLLAFLYYLGSLDPPGDAEAGARTFRQKGCQTCHSLGGRGGAVGPPLDKYGRYASPLFLTAALWNRGAAMAAMMRVKGVPRPTFQGNDIPDLLAYLRSTGDATEWIYSTPGRPRRGEKLFTEKRCVECHSIHGHGGKTGPDLGTELKGSLMRIAGTMWNHGPGMWAKMTERGMNIPSLSTEEMSDLIGYLYFLQFIDPPGDSARGLALYREKQCATCHSPDPAAKVVGPPIDQVVEGLRTPVELVTAMWNHAGKMTAIMLEENLSWPTLKRGEIVDLVAYLLHDRSRGAKPAAPKGVGPGGRKP
jgi:cytochrome c2